MLSLKEIREKHYTHQRSKLVNMNADIDDWLYSPYNCFKARIYIEISSILVYFLQRTHITPNTITILYAISGILGGFFFYFESKNLILTACFIFYFKGVLDWSDGLLARIKGRTSSLGHILDAWGSNVGYIAFVSGLSLHCFNLSGDMAYIILLIFFLIFKSLDFKTYLYQQSYYEILNKTNNIEINFIKTNNLKEDKKKLMITFLKSFMDDRARTTDTVILIIVLNLYFDLLFYIKFIIFLYFLKSMIIFLGNLYYFYFKNS